MRKEFQIVFLMRRGEKPTCAGPLLVQKFLSALRLATGRRGRTRAGPRGVVTKWSDRTSLLGSGWWRGVRRTRPSHAGSAWSRSSDFVVGVYTDRLGGPQRDYRSRQARWQSTVTTGKPHDVDPAIRQAKTRLYKLCEISSRRRWRDGFVRVFWRSQLLPPKPWPMARWSWNLLRESSRRRGEEPQWKRCTRAYDIMSTMPCHEIRSPRRVPLACANERCRSGLRTRDTAWSGSLRAPEENPGSWLGNGRKCQDARAYLATYGR